MTKSQELLIPFLKHKTIKEVLLDYPQEELGLGELQLDSTRYVFGNKELIAYTETCTYVWELNDYGNGYVFVLVDEYLND